MIDNQILAIEGWTIRFSQPSSLGNHPVVIMLHGLTGDENSMWIFARHLQSRFIVIAPRGIHPTARGGYDWHNYRPGPVPQVNVFFPAVDAILSMLALLSTQPQFREVDFTQLSLIGFSQGAALAYVLALRYPHLVNKLAGLSGFLPDSATSLLEGQPLNNKFVFVSHGTQDKVISIARAKQSIQLLQQAGAQVQYCEDDNGHQVSLKCIKSMETFFGV